MKTNKHGIAVILRGEISAFKAYNQIVKDVNNFQDALELRNMRSDHAAAIDFWENEAKLKNIKHDVDPGAWGALVQTLISTTKVLGLNASLKTIKAGEEYGLEAYYEMLSNKFITQRIKGIIETHFIPIQRKHINTLNNLTS